MTDPVVTLPCLPDEAASHPAAVYLARLAPGSRPAMASALKIAATIVSGGRTDVAGLQWAALQYAHTQALRAELAARYQPATVGRILAAVRGVLREAWRLGQMREDTYRRAIDVGAPRGDGPPAGRALEAEELKALFAVVRRDGSPRGQRDLALLSLLWAGGLRRAEVCRLDRADCRGLPELRVHGKGNRVRLVPLPEYAAGAVAAWLALSARAVPETGPAFVGLDGAGRCGGRLDPRSVSKLLARRAREAKLSPCTPHDLRRSYATELLERGARLEIVAELMGHRDVRTTQRYARRLSEAKRKAVGLLTEPRAGDG